MAVLVEALSVVIKDSSLRYKYIGGIKEFLQTIPNKTYCSDGQLHRIGFMRPQDTEAYVRNLQQNGLIFLFRSCCIDMAVVDMLNGVTAHCKWLGFARQKFFKGFSEYSHCGEDFSIAWHIDDSSVYGIPLNQKRECAISVPKHWTPDKAIYGNNFIPADKLKDQLIEVEDEKGVVKFLYSQTGEFVYVGKPKIKFTDNSRRN